ncbi:hypothetical protein SAMD00019534_042740 [Acytostelium subglobosum LB1]|uniref:hypothetical protein n=1 Tax=Acytostelium subglobosum LB1 TaxID=1410327 RepID=UPI000644DCC5|nr:hypothetical protein SAMD00019534_042740 [Acytostelium subglobosum LB1]GAM21099.1 hypothetical protein SAMD00019534_042740 [Acytostelium subglobosum LB1]|eukprot:XP_012756233.1 hypothetical protein SAMD00019534_042740 [Acytostelium subglobosum LB1]
MFDSVCHYDLSNHFINGHHFYIINTNFTVGVAISFPQVDFQYIKLNRETGTNFTQTIPVNSNIQSMLQVYNNGDILFYTNSDTGNLPLYHPGNNTITNPQSILYTDAQSSYAHVPYSGTGYNANTNTVYSFVVVNQTFDIGVLAISFNDQSFEYTSLTNRPINVTAWSSCYDPNNQTFYASLLLSDAVMQTAVYDTFNKAEVMLFNVSLDIDVDNDWFGEPFLNVYVWDSLMYVMVGADQPGYPLWIGVVDLETQHVKTIMQDNLMLLTDSIPTFSVDPVHGYMSAYGLDVDSETAYLYMLDMSTQAYTKIAQPKLYVGPQDFMYEAFWTSS